MDKELDAFEEEFEYWKSNRERIFSDQNNPEILNLSGKGNRFQAQQGMLADFCKFTDYLQD